MDDGWTFHEKIELFLHFDVSNIRHAIKSYFHFNKTIKLYLLDIKFMVNKCTEKFVNGPANV